MTAGAVLGAIIAGGASTRFGSPKALAEIAGERIIDRVVASLRSVTPEIVVIANDATVAEAVSLPSRPDAIAGAGALGGVYTALLWAEERGFAGILATACDMPFLNAALLRSLIDRAARGFDVVLPQSGGRRASEPLCAFYSTACAGPIRSAIDRGDRRMIAFHGDVELELVPLHEVSRFGDPEVLFMNVNTEADLERATLRVAEQCP